VKIMKSYMLEKKLNSQIMSCDKKFYRSRLKKQKRCMCITSTKIRRRACMICLANDNKTKQGSVTRTKPRNHFSAGKSLSAFSQFLPAEESSKFIGKVKYFCERKNICINALLRNDRKSWNSYKSRRHLRHSSQTVSVSQGYGMKTQLKK